MFYVLFSSPASLRWCLILWSLHSHSNFAEDSARFARQWSSPFNFLSLVFFSRKIMGVHYRIGIDCLVHIRNPLAFYNLFIPFFNRKAGQALTDPIFDKDTYIQLYEPGRATQLFNDAKKCSPDDPFSDLKLPAAQSFAFLHLPGSFLLALMPSLDKHLFIKHERWFSMGLREIWETEGRRILWSSVVASDSCSLL